MYRLKFHPGRRQQAGFTLVEMAVVMVIIGLILGAVMIARDGQRNAEYLRIRQTFLNQWELAYNAYYTHRHAVLGDSLSARQAMVNGANFDGASGGNMTGVTPPNAVCEGAKGQLMVREAQEGVSLRRLVMDAGIELPPGRAVGQEDRYVYLDTNGNPQEIKVCFQWNPPGTDSGSGNVMVISGLTPDLARALDEGLDNTVDASSGRFRQEGVQRGAGDAPGLEWTAFNTQAYGGSVPVDGKDIDREAQVITVVAHLKMNQ